MQRSAVSRLAAGLAAGLTAALAAGSRGSEPLDVDARVAVPGAPWSLRLVEVEQNRRWTSRAGEYDPPPVFAPPPPALRLVLEAAGPAEALETLREPRYFLAEDFRGNHLALEARWHRASQATGPDGRLRVARPSLVLTGAALPPGSRGLRWVQGTVYEHSAADPIRLDFPYPLTSPPPTRELSGIEFRLEEARLEGQQLTVRWRATRLDRERSSRLSTNRAATRLRDASGGELPYRVDRHSTSSRVDLNRRVDEVLVTDIFTGVTAPPAVVSLEGLALAPTPAARRVRLDGLRLTRVPDASPPSPVHPAVQPGSRTRVLVPVAAGPGPARGGVLAVQLLPRRWTGPIVPGGLPWVVLRTDRRGAASLADLRPGEYDAQFFWQEVGRPGVPGRLLSAPSRPLKLEPGDELRLPPVDVSLMTEPRF